MRRVHTSNNTEPTATTTVGKETCVVETKIKVWRTKAGVCVVLGFSLIKRTFSLVINRLWIQCRVFNRNSKKPYYHGLLVFGSIFCKFEII